MKMRFEEKLIAGIMALILALSLLPLSGIGNRNSASVPLSAAEPQEEEQLSEDRSAVIVTEESSMGSDGEIQSPPEENRDYNEEYDALQPDDEAEMNTESREVPVDSETEASPAVEEDPLSTEPDDAGSEGGEADESAMSASEPVKKKNVNKMEIDPELQLSIDEDTFVEYADFLRSELGFNTAAISGVLANLQQESGFDINKIGDMGFAYGLCQWRGARLEKMTEFCRENGLNPVTREGQLAYFRYEMKEVYIYAYDLIRQVPNDETGVERATYYFCAYYEVPSDPNEVVPARLKLAQQLIYPTLAELGYPVGS